MATLIDDDIENGKLISSFFKEPIKISEISVNFNVHNHCYIEHVRELVTKSIVFDIRTYFFSII
jgi:hypothetical protein